MVTMTIAACFGAAPIIKFLITFVAIVWVALAITASLIFGFYAGRNGFWKHLPYSILLGTASIMFWYAFAGIVLNANGSASDIGAATGVVMLTVPTAIVLTVLLLIGAGVGFLISRASR